MTHICVGNLTIIGPDNDLSPGRRQAIIWTNAGILLIGPRGTNFSEILIGIHMKIHLKMSSAKWRPFCLGLNVLTHRDLMNSSIGAYQREQSFRYYKQVFSPLTFTVAAWWRHQMETFSALLAICAGNSPGPRWIPRTKASDAELWCLLSSVPE